MLVQHITTRFLYLTILRTLHYVSTATVRVHTGMVHHFRGYKRQASRFCASRLEALNAEQTDTADHRVSVLAQGRDCGDFRRPRGGLWHLLLETPSSIRHRAQLDQ